MGRAERRRPQEAGEPGEPGRPCLRLGRYDRTVRYALAYKMAPIFTVIGTPAWANASAGWNVRSHEPGRPAGVRDRRRAPLLRDLPRRERHARRPRRKWIAWNEPNNPVFLKPQFVRSGSKWVIQSASHYAKICNAVVKGVKRVKASSKVACGVTSPRGNNQPGTPRSSVSPLAFLRWHAEAGAKGFDAYAHHPYYGSPSETPYTKPPPGKRGAPPTAVTLGNFELLTKELQRLYGNMRIWVTEYGYQTNPPDKHFGVTPAKQALYMQQAWEKLAPTRRST